MFPVFDDHFRFSKFAVIFAGDHPDAYLEDGWDAALDRVKREVWDGINMPDWWPEFTEKITDPEQWAANDFGPLHYRDEIGEDCFLTIYRLEEE